MKSILDTVSIIPSGTASLPTETAHIWFLYRHKMNFKFQCVFPSSRIFFIMKIYTPLASDFSSSIVSSPPKIGNIQWSNDPGIKKASNFVVFWFFPFRFAPFLMKLGATRGAARPAAKKLDMQESSSAGVVFPKSHAKKRCKAEKSWHNMNLVWLSQKGCSSFATFFLWHLVQPTQKKTFITSAEAAVWFPASLTNVNLCFFVLKVTSNFQ